jgi:hypothetical protein
VSACLRWYITGFDVSNAYLRAVLPEEIYLKLPGNEGFDAIPDGGRYRIHKSLYGLKQAGERWNVLFIGALDQFGYRMSNADPCLYLKTVDNILLVLLFHVDDVLLASKSRLIADTEKQKLIRHFGKARDLGDVPRYLAIDLDHSNGRIELSQRLYIDTTLKQLLPDKDTYKDTPLSPSINLRTAERGTHPPLWVTTGKLRFLVDRTLLLADLGIMLPKPILIYEDNQPTINIVSTRAHHASTNYMNVKINYIRQQIQSHQITVQYCPTSEMVADMLTKALPKAQFEYLRRKLLGSAPSRPTEK